MQRPWPLVKGNGFILVSVCLPGIISASSKAVNYPKGSKPNPGHWHYMGGTGYVQYSQVQCGLYVDILLYPLQYIPPACSPLCPMRLVCTATVYSTVAKCNRPKWSERSAARAAVRAVRSGPLPVLAEYGTIPYHYR